MNNIKTYFGALVLGAFLAFFALGLVSQIDVKTHAATVTRGTTFTTNQQVQYTDLHALVDNATVSSIVSADITDGTIVAADISDSTITSAKIVNGTIVSADIANRGVDTANYQTNSVDVIALSSNLFFRSGFMSFSNVVVADGSISNNGVLGVTSSSGSANSGSIPKLDANGKLDNSLFNAPVVTNIFMTAEVQSTADTYVPLVTYTFPQTNGYVIVNFQCTPKSKDSTTINGASTRLLRISGNTTPYTTNIAMELTSHGPAEGGSTMSGCWAGIINSTNTFVIQGETSVSSAQIVWGGTSKDYYSAADGAGTGGTNSTGMVIMDFK